jgi:hypothetical protein
VGCYNFENEYLVKNDHLLCGLLHGSFLELLRALMVEEEDVTCMQVRLMQLCARWLIDGMDESALAHLSASCNA